MMPHWIFFLSAAPTPNWFSQKFGNLRFSRPLVHVGGRLGSHKTRISWGFPVVCPESTGLAQGPQKRAFYVFSNPTEVYCFIPRLTFKTCTNGSHFEIITIRSVFVSATNKVFPILASAPGLPILMCVLCR